MISVKSPVCNCPVFGRVGEKWEREAEDQEDEEEEKEEEVRNK